MHKDGWFSSRCGWGAWRVKHGWLSSSGPDAFSRSQFADLRRGLSQAGGGGPRFHTPGYKPPVSPALRPWARLLPPRPPGGGPDHKATAGVETRTWSGVSREAMEVASGPSPRHPTPQRGPSGGQAWALKFRGRRRLPGGARSGRGGRRWPPAQGSPGRRHQPEQRRTGAGNAPPIGQP